MRWTSAKLEASGTGVRRGRPRQAAAAPRRPEQLGGPPMPDGRQPGPGGWNRIDFIVDDIAADVDRLRSAGLTFRNKIISGPGGQQVLLEDLSGNPRELFRPAG
jgi:hypothetical protein